MEIRAHKNKILTPRETEVIYWVPLGKSNYDISRILSCSEQTIANHCNSIYSKLNVVNRAQAVAKAILKGIISVHVLMLALIVNASDIDLRRGARRQSRRRIVAHTAYSVRIVDPYYMPNKDDPLNSRNGKSTV